LQHPATGFSSHSFPGSGHVAVRHLFPVSQSLSS
jgi:hypothetical protein